MSARCGADRRSPSRARARWCDGASRQAARRPAQAGYGAPSRAACCARRETRPNSPNTARARRSPRVNAARASSCSAPAVQSGPCASRRLSRIVVVALRHGLDDLVLGHARVRCTAADRSTRALFWRDLSAPRARAAAARAGGPRADLRQVRPDAVDAARPLAARHRRRARASCRIACRRFRRTQVDRDARRASTASRSTRCSRRSTARRSRARRSRRCISPSCPTARRSR